MKIAIISDIHSNSEALISVLEMIESIGVDEIYCLGDIVGYGPDPNDCILQVRENSSVVIAGNHDFAAVELTDISYFNVYARDAINWTANELDENNQEFLSTLEIMHQVDDALFVHATPENPEEWDYILSNFDAESNFQVFSEQVCFIGHSHSPVIFKMGKNGDVRTLRESVLECDPQCRYIINIGSVGQPRDADPRASFGIFDTETRMYELKRTDYAIEITQSRIIEAGLPRFLADRLSRGQ